MVVMFSKAGSTFALVLSVGASVVALAACGSGTPAAAGSPTAAATGAAPGSPTASASAGTGTGTGTGTGAGSASTPECKASQLQIAYTDNAQIRNGALDGMSKADSVLTFTNAGSATCVIQGYPGVAALGANGAQIKQAARTTQAVSPVYLKPGGVASTMVAANTASCSTLTRVADLLVTAPDQYTSTQLTSGAELCLDSLTVSPVVPGNAAGLSL
jgi:hypothetical protein